jgi:hypothetical protein
MQIISGWHFTGSRIMAIWENLLVEIDGRKAINKSPCNSKTVVSNSELFEE